MLILEDNFRLQAFAAELFISCILDVLPGGVVYWRGCGQSGRLFCSGIRLFLRLKIVYSTFKCILFSKPSGFLQVYSWKP